MNRAREYTLREKQTVYSPDLFLKIHDEDGNIFYQHPNKEKSIVFNLPAGKFSTANNIRAIGTFKPYPLLNFEGGEEKVPGSWNVLETENPNRASIWLKSRNIHIDPSVRKLNYRPALAFVIGHELGHNVFHRKDGEMMSSEDSAKMELNCDMWSFNRMMETGYNPSQVLTSAIMLLPHTTRPNSLQSFITELKTRRTADGLV